MNLSCYQVYFEVNGQRSRTYVKASSSDDAKGKVLLQNANVKVTSVSITSDSNCG